MCAHVGPIRVAVRAPDAKLGQNANPIKSDPMGPFPALQINFFILFFVYIPPNPPIQLQLAVSVSVDIHGYLPIPMDIQDHLGTSDPQWGA